MENNHRGEYIRHSANKYLNFAISIIILLFLLFLPRLTLEFNRAKWKLLGPSHFRYELKIVCRCTAELTPVIIEMKDDQVVSVTDADGQKVNKGDSIERLFDIIQGVLPKANMVRVKYDGGYGFPTAILVDPTNWIDDEMAYQIKNFEVLP